MKYILLVATIGLLLSCTSVTEEEEEENESAFMTITLNRNPTVLPTPLNLTEIYAASGMSLLNLDEPVWGHPIRDWYFSLYQNHLEFDTRIYSGLYPSNGELLAAHIIEGEDTSKGTLIFIHGFVESVYNPYGVFFSEEYIPKGYRVVLLNLPGHEFSGGNRTSIPKFEYYGDMLYDFLMYTEGQLGDTIVATGHSVGATLIYDALARFPEVREMIDASVLLTPFSSINNSGMLATGSLVLSSAVVKLNFMPLVDEDGNFLGHHVLGNKYQYIPPGWINVQRAWEVRIQDYPVIDENMFIVFGSRDIVIEPYVSYTFYKAKTSNAYITMYEGQDHLLSEETEEVIENNASIDVIQNDLLNWLDGQLEEIHGQ